MNALKRGDLPATSKIHRLSSAPHRSFCLMRPVSRKVQADTKPAFYSHQDLWNLDGNDRRI